VGINQPIAARPSALPAAAVFRVRDLASDLTGGFDHARYPDGCAGSAVAVAASRAAGLEADLQISRRGTSVPTATLGSASGFQQSQVKQINAVTGHRMSGVGGAPPRGRPN
jgi:hypothetical protein